MDPDAVKALQSLAADAQALLQPLAPGIAAWTAAFLLVRFALFPRRSADFGNRVVSIAHALGAIALAVPALDWAAPLATVGQANTAAQARARGRARGAHPVARVAPPRRAAARPKRAGTSARSASRLSPG